MQKINNYTKIYKTLIRKTQDYIVTNNIKAMILGISGGIDSTVCAAICHEVSKRTNIPLIGRSLPTKNNKFEEINTANLVGKAFCDDYKEVNIHGLYNRMLYLIGETEDSCLDLSGNIMYEIIGEFPKQQTLVANGNIQARLRMIYLYNLASIYKGMVIDTDNLTENNLGYFTIHGDVGDFNPIGGLWKTEIFELAKNIKTEYNLEILFNESYSNRKIATSYFNKHKAIEESLKLQPTAGLGITNNDLEELGAESYEQVDSILQEILAWKRFIKKQGVLPESILEQKEMFLNDQQILNIPINIIISVANRHFNSEFKRKQLPIKITREWLLDD